MKRILIRTVDTDVVILAIAFTKKLEVEELWVAFGVGKHLRYLPIHKIASSLSTQQREGLPFFHAFTWPALPEALKSRQRANQMWVQECMSGTLQVHQGKLALHCTVHLQWQLLSRMTMLRHGYLQNATGRLLSFLFSSE